MRIDGSLLNGIKQVGRTGFHILVAYVSHRAGKHTQILVDWIHKIFGPLLEVAKTAYQPPGPVCLTLFRLHRY
jgi:hypothetical protein